MTKAIIATTAKVTITHDRISLVVKFLDGHILKTAINRNSDSFSIASPVGAKTVPDGKSLFAFICKSNRDETYGDRFNRLAKFFEEHDSIHTAIAAAK